MAVSTHDDNWLTRLPRELSDHILAYLTISDRLVLRVVSRQLHHTIATPGLLRKAEVSHIADRLGHDRYQLLCQRHRIGFTSSLQLPCARCRQLHPTREFLTDQLSKADDKRLCKRYAAIQMCPCTHFTWRTLEKWVPRTPYTDMPNFPEDRECGSGAFSCNGWLIRTIRHSKLALVLPARMNDKISDLIGLKTSLELRWLIKVPPLVNPSVPQDIVDVFRNVSLRICPHLSTSDFPNMRRFGRRILKLIVAGDRDRKRMPDIWSKYDRYYSPLKGKCPERTCRTQYFFHNRSLKGSLTMVVIKNLGVLDLSRDPMQNKKWLMQISTPLSDSRPPITFYSPWTTRLK